MRRLITLGLIGSVVRVLVGVVPVAAGSRTDATMTVTTIFDDFPDRRRSPLRPCTPT